LRLTVPVRDGLTAPADSLGP